MIRHIVAIMRALAAAVTGCATALLPALAPVGARAQSDEPSRVSTQLWANITAGKTVGERWYLELDAEPKWQVTSAVHEGPGVVLGRGLGLEADHVLEALSPVA